MMDWAPLRGLDYFVRREGVGDIPAYYCFCYCWLVVPGERIGEFDCALRGDVTLVFVPFRI
jgi:hypothetical protein